jgi:hypothetical protein
MLTPELDDVVVMVRDQADIIGQDLRHPTSAVQRTVNDAYKALQDRVSGLGYDLFLIATPLAPLPSAPVAPGQNYSVVPWPADAREVHGVDVLAHGEWTTLSPVAMQQRRSWQARSSSFLRPVGFSVLSAGSELALFPFSSEGQYQLWYVVNSADLAGNGELLLLNQSWLDWVVAETALRRMRRDNVKPAQLREIKELRAEAEQRILRAAPVKAGPKTWTRSQHYHARGRRY